jgi:hypothetical protein
VATATFRLLYALIVLGHDRRRILHFEVTQNPTRVWLSHQITEAFPWDTAPRYLLRDRDASYGSAFRDRVRVMGIKEVVTAPRSPWQNPYVERLIGPAQLHVRRESPCVGKIVAFPQVVDRISVKEIVSGPCRKGRPWPSRHPPHSASHQRPSPKQMTIWPQIDRSARWSEDGIDHGKDKLQRLPDIGVPKYNCFDIDIFNLRVHLDKADDRRGSCGGV